MWSAARSIKCRLTLSRLYLKLPRPEKFGTILPHSLGTNGFVGLSLARKQRPGTSASLRVYRNSKAACAAPVVGLDARIGEDKRADLQA